MSGRDAGLRDMAETAKLAWRFGRVLGLRGKVVAEAEPAGRAAWVVPVVDGNSVGVGAGAGVGTARALPGAAEFDGLRALVADDSEINCTILRTFLERLGFEVTLAADGLQALDRWKPGVHDLLCLDIDMPELDGLAALERMKVEAAKRGVPMPMALAVTISAMTQEVTTYLQAGFDACLPKPFSRGDLVDLLRRRWPATAA